MTGKTNPKRAEVSQASVTFSPYLMRRHSEQLADWLQANGVDPSTVTADHPVVVIDGVIHYRALSLDSSDQPAEDYEDGELITGERTARCVEPAPNLAG